MESQNNPLSSKNILAGVIVGVLGTVIGGVILAYIIQDARFAPKIKTSVPPTNTSVPPTETSPMTPKVVDLGSTDLVMEITPIALQNRSIDGMEMAFVPGGEFQMGSSKTEIDAAFELCEQQLGSGECSKDWFEHESPQHTVSLAGFWIDRTEVTNAQYRKCVDAGDCQGPTTCDWGEPTYEDPSKANHPVVCVDWYGANAYCEWAGARLPTEAEWEYAARGPNEYIYPWGDTFDGTLLNFCDVNCTYDWMNTDYDDGYEETAPVGSFEGGASWCEALDMAGNVWEWVNDWYGDYSSGLQSNPAGPETGDSKVLRGGSWFYLSTNVRSAIRLRYQPGSRYVYGGFRCAGVPTP